MLHKRAMSSPVLGLRIGDSVSYMEHTAKWGLLPSRLQHAAEHSAKGAEEQSWKNSRNLSKHGTVKNHGACK